MLLNSRFGFFLLFLLSTIRCLGDEKKPVSYLGIEQGLSNNAVTSIYQDGNGFMWFGTYDGLNKYDGYGFKVFRNVINDKTSLTDNHVSVIHEDALRQLWIGTEKGLSIYNLKKSNFVTASFRASANAPLQPLKDVVRDIQRVGTGEMLVGTHSGLLVFEKSGYVGLQIRFTQWKGRETNYDATALAYDSLRKISWVFVYQAGLCQYDQQSKTLRLVNASIKQASCLKLDRKGNLWLGNENGLFRYDIHSNAYSNNLFPTRNRIVSLFQDKQNVLWIATDGNGVWTMPSGGQPAPYLSTDGTSLVNSNAVYAVYEDNDGGKWIGTLRGGISVIRASSKLFKHITYTTPGQNNIIDNFILSFGEDEKSNVWIGTDGAGLRYWNRKKNTYTSFVHNAGDAKSISSNFVTNILHDARGDFWFATWFGGVNRLKNGSQSFEHFECINPETNSVENNAWLVFEDAQKKVWVSTTNDGTLYTFNRTTNRFDAFDPKITNIQSLFEDKNGDLWAGDYSSLIKIDRVNRRHQTYNLGYTVRSIYEDGNKNFWIGTDGGGLLLFNREKGTYQRFSTAEGLPSNSVLRILEDRKRNLWLSTYNGLCKFNPADKVCRSFSLSDGLQSNQFSFNAALALQSGEFLFGGIKGFNLFYPDSIYEKKEAPKMFLTSLRINNKPIEEDDSYVTERSLDQILKVVLPYEQATLALDFVALEYSGTDKIKYAYKLDEWDKAWNYVNNVRSANYSRLQEGTYTFKIKVTNTAGIWSEETKLLTIVVLPPWYRTWWAYLVYASIIAAVIYLYITYNKRQERLRYEIKLAHFENEKEKEITEKKLSFFTHISHEFRTPLTLIINPIKDLLQKIEAPDEHQQLRIVHRNARRLLSLVDQLLIFRKADVEADNMKFSKVNFYKLCHEVYLCFVQQAKLNHQEFLFQCDNKEIELYVDREKIEIALFNLISNAIKYTPEKRKIIFAVTENETEVEVSVEDNGYGIPKEAATRLYEKFYQANSEKAPAKTGFGIGLYLVKHFVEGHKGQISFESEEGRGTIFQVHLKKGKEHLEGQVILKEPQKEPAILEELAEEPQEVVALPVKKENRLEEVITDRHTILLVDDDKSIRQYLHQVLNEKYEILEAENGVEALKLAQTKFPDLIISDIRMNEMDGIQLCKQIKGDQSLNHIPVILLTGSYGPEVELQGIEGGADVYITKPFDKDILLAKVENLFKSRSELQNYFFNEITLKKNTLKISPEYKEFLDRCIAIVEKHLDDDQFTIKVLAREIGMSHSNLYKRVKLISGQSVSSFIRYIRLRKAAELMIRHDANVNQAAFQVGINDVKYFRVQFNKLFGMNPSDYIKKFREPFNKDYQISANAVKETVKR